MRIPAAKFGKLTFKAYPTVAGLVNNRELGQGLRNCRARYGPASW
jgi:hypothetical protein